MGQVWFGTNLQFKGLLIFVYNQKLKPLPLRQFKEEKNTLRWSAFVHKKSVKGIN